MNGRQRGRRREVPDAEADLCPDPGKCQRGPDPHAWTTDCELDEGWAELSRTEPAEPLVSDEELEAIRWASYDAAMSDATAHRNQALDAAEARLDGTMRRAYQEYGRALDAAEAAFTAARRAAMNAHELAQAGQTLAPGYDSEPAGASQ